MKVLIVNTSDIQGGAARAAYRLHNSLLTEGIDSELLANYKNSDDISVDVVTKSHFKIFKAKLAALLDRLKLRKYKYKSNALFSPGMFSSHDTVKLINMKKPDIVHLHWINHGMLSINDIANIKAPIVWSLHDMWLFTGGCHYDEECGRYRFSCGRCKILKSNQERDLSRRIYLNKKQIFRKKKEITVVGLSKWIRDSAKESSLLKNTTVINLPNPIDTDIFSISDKQVTRKLWNLPLNKKLILFGALGATSDTRKGFIELVSALKEIDSNNIEFIIFGESKNEHLIELNCKVNYIGPLYDDVSLVALYNSADVMVVPSRQENLSNSIMESLSCGTPVVAFNIGGNADLIDHMKNGFLATPFNSVDLAKGIKWILNHKDYNLLVKNSRLKAQENFEASVVSKKYICLYEEIIKKSITHK